MKTKYELSNQTSSDELPFGKRKKIRSLVALLGAMAPIYHSTTPFRMTVEHEGDLTRIVVLDGVEDRHECCVEQHESIDEVTLSDLLLELEAVQMELEDIKQFVGLTDEEDTCCGCC